MSTLLFSFGVIADCQYADRDNTTALGSDDRHIHDNHYRDSLGKLEETIDFFNTQELEFIVHLGDFVDEHITQNAPPVLEVVARAHAPFWHVLGNHDYMKAQCSEQDILQLYGLTVPYYSNVVAGHRFIVLDTNELGVIKHAENTPAYEDGAKYLQQYIDAGVPQAKSWNGGVSDAQLEWLTMQIAEANAKNERVILFSHHPVFPPNGSNALNDEEVLSTIDKSEGVAAYLNGHNHFGAVGVRKDVPYITMPAILQGTTNAYSVARVYDDKLELVSYGRAQDLEVKLQSFKGEK